MCVCVIDEFDFFSFPSNRTDAILHAVPCLSFTLVTLANVTTKFDCNRSACGGISNGQNRKKKKRIEKECANDSVSTTLATFCAESCEFNKRTKKKILSKATRYRKTIV